MKQNFNDKNTELQIKKINSLSTAIKKLEHSQNRTRNTSNREMNRLMSTTSGIISKIGYATNTMTNAIKSTTIGTVKYTNEAVKQYSEALQQDIQLDTGKLSVLAMKGGPVIGYFITKLFQTPAFKNAMDEIKNKISKSLSTTAEKFKDIILSGAVGIRNNIFSVFNKVGNIYRKIVGRKTKEFKRKIYTPKMKEKSEDFYVPNRINIPKLQKGGVINKGGVAKLHPAEVVMPIKQLAKMNQKIIEKNSEKLLESFRETRRESYKEYDAPFYKKFLNALFYIRAALIKQPGMISMRLGAVWNNILENHPLFRHIVQFEQLFSEIFIKTPWRILTGRFGGLYRKLVSNNKHPMIAIAQTTSEFYPLMVFRQDEIIQLLKLSLEAQRDTSSAISGKKYTGVKQLKFGRASLSERIGTRLYKFFKNFFKEFKTHWLTKITLIISSLLTILLKFKGGTEKLFNKLLEKEKSFDKSYKDIYKKVRKSIDFLTEKINEFYKKTIKPFISKTWNIIKKFYVNHIKPIISKIENLFKEYIKPIFDSIWNKIKKFYIKYIQPTIKKIETLYDKFSKTIIGKKLIDNITLIVKYLKVISGFISKYFGEKGEKDVQTKKPSTIDNIMTLGLSRFAPEKFFKFKEFINKHPYLFPVAGISNKFGAITSQAKTEYESNKLLLDVLKNKKDSGTLSPSAYKLITSGKEFETGNRYSELKQKGDIVQLGRYIITKSEFEDIRKKALSIQKENLINNPPKNIINLLKEKAEMTKKYYDISHEIIENKMKELSELPEYKYSKQIVQEKTKKLEKYSKPKLEKIKEKYKYIKESSEPYIKDIYKNLNTSKNLIIEKSKPIISKSKIIETKVKEKTQKIAGEIKSSKEYKEGLESMKKLQTNMINNFNNVTNVINNSMSNMIDNMQTEPNNIGLDPIMIDILERGLD